MERDGRSAARDARKQHRKDKERVKGKQRHHDRQVKEGALRDESDDLTAAAVAAEQLSSTGVSSFLVERVRRSLQWVCATRVTRRQRLLAFAMCRHWRLGQDSAARVLSRDVMTVIARFVPGTLVVVGGGTEAKDRVKQEDEEEEDVGFEERFTYEASLSMWQWNGHRTWQELPDLPEPNRDCQMLYVAEREEVWCVGGYDEDTRQPFGRALVLSLKSLTWRRVKDVVNPPRAGGTSFVYRNMIVTLGGHIEGQAAPDSLFCMSGERAWRKWPVSQWSPPGSVFMTCAVIRDVLFVSWTAPPYGEPNSGRSCILDLSQPFPTWAPFFPFDGGTDSCPVILDDSLFLVGSFVDSGCPTCSFSTRRVWQLNLDAGNWELLEQSQLPFGLKHGRAVYTRDSVQVCGGHTGSFWENLGDEGWQRYVLRLDRQRMKWRAVGLAPRDLLKFTEVEKMQDALVFPKRLTDVGVVQISM